MTESTAARPQQNSHPTARLSDINNTEPVVLSSYHQLIAATTTTDSRALTSSEPKTSAVCSSHALLLQESAPTSTGTLPLTPSVLPSTFSINKHQLVELDSDSDVVDGGQARRKKRKATVEGE